jgi:hypothetical protein
VNAKTGTYMEFEEKEISDFVNSEASTDAHHVFMQSWAAKVASLLSAASSTSATKSSGDAANAPSSPSGASIGLQKGANLSKSYARRIHRRRMVADCKALRAQIYEFEQEYAKRYNRQPKTQDRGMMQTVYSKYRDLKREIRDCAATDIQRAIRGYLARSALIRENRLFFRRLKPTIVGSSSSVSSAAMEVASSSGSEKMGIGGKFLSFKDTLDESSTIGGNVSDANQSAATEIFGKLRDILEQKKDLKKKLKKFDEDFLEQHGRQPKKADKEVIRPMYQRYHEVKLLTSFFRF